jgi:hypothetical protein
LPLSRSPIPIPEVALLVVHVALRASAGVGSSHLALTAVVVSTELFQPRALLSSETNTIQKTARLTPLFARDVVSSVVPSSPSRRVISTQ